ncbi:MAG TPA: aminoglycoside phosphotransferase family protein [Pilimelia sp.]|nr:aminoglycoside phosphotransferase family protein [Pilimelia sp.]
MTVHADIIPVSWARADGHTPLADVVTRPGTRAVLLGGSRDPNAKVTLVLLDDYGPAFVVKVATTGTAAQVVRNEGALLEALAGAGLGRLAPTLPRAIGYLSADGLPALVTTALTGVPMTVRYHGWRHIARRRRVRADFAAAGAWLADLQARSAGPPAPVTLLADSLETITTRFAGHPALPALTDRLAASAQVLAGHATPRTIVHGDYWFGNLLLADGRVVGVVDWECGALTGEPLRDVARFPVSYALYLDRHTRPGRRVRGHRQLRADSWGAGIAYAVNGRGWFPEVVRRYLADALTRLGLPAELSRDVLIAGIAEVAATADHPDFARDHLEVLARILDSTVDGGVP